MVDDGLQHLDHFVQQVAEKWNQLEAADTFVMVVVVVVVVQVAGVHPIESVLVDQQVNALDQVHGMAAYSDAAQPDADGMT